MTIIILIICISLLLLLMFKSIEGYFLANILLALVLPTLDRMSGSFAFNYSLIKMPFFALGYLYYFIKYKNYQSLFSKNAFTINILFVVFLLSSVILCIWHKDLKINTIFTTSGLTFFPLVYLSSNKSFSFISFIRKLILWVLMPLAIFGIFQYLIGPSNMSNLGFSLVTPNTESAFSKTFTTDVIDNTIQSIRPFSFLNNSADFAAMMFFAVIMLFILGDYLFKKRHKTLLIILFIIALFIAQYITIILITIGCIVLYSIFISKNRQFKTSLFIALIFIISLFFISLYFPDVYIRVFESLSLETSSGSYTSAYYRFMWILQYPELIKSHILLGYGKPFDYYVFSADSHLLYYSLYYGWIVCISYLLIYIYFGVKSRFLARNERDVVISKIYNLVFLTTIAVILGSLSNGHIITTTPSNLLVFIILGVVIKKQGQVNDNIYLSKLN